MRGNEQVVDRRRGGPREQDDLLVGQGLDGDRLLPGEAVRSGNGKRPLIVGERGAGGEIWLVDGKPVAQNVDITPPQRPVGVEGLDLLEPDLATWVTGLERGDEPAERRTLSGENETDAQQPADGTRQLAGLGQGPVHGSQRGHEAALERLARGREADPAAGPVEDLDPEPGLNDPHCLAHPGLGDAQALGRPAEVQLVGKHEEDPQLP